MIIVRSNDFPEISHKELDLWIWYADKIPPHIGCSIDGFYFSLKVSGKDKGVPVERVRQIIEKKHVPFLLIKTKTKVSLADMHSAFDAYDNAGTNGVTCLKPILDLYKPADSINQLGDLISFLEARDGIKIIFGINLPETYSGLPHYGLDEIRERLRKLEDAKRIKSISAGS